MNGPSSFAIEWSTLIILYSVNVSKAVILTFSVATRQTYYAIMTSLLVKRRFDVITTLLLFSWYMHWPHDDVIIVFYVTDMVARRFPSQRIINSELWCWPEQADNQQSNCRWFVTSLLWNIHLKGQSHGKKKIKSSVNVRQPRRVHGSNAVSKTCVWSTVIVAAWTD